MNPFYFGSGERRLFGIYEPARPAGGRVRAALLCNPCGPEYLHAHRSLRQLAAKLTAAGHHTLRFDYFATGDSAGDSAAADLAGWEADTVTALEELRDIAGVARVALIGLRLGANLAARVAARRSADVEALLLWDPIVDPLEYLNSLRPAAARARPAGAGSDAWHDHALPPALRSGIESLDWGATAGPLPRRSLVIASDGAAARAAHGRRLPAELAMEHLAAPPAWDESATITGAVPARVLRRIVEWLA